MFTPSGKRGHEEYSLTLPSPHFPPPSVEKTPCLYPQPLQRFPVCPSTLFFCQRNITNVFNTAEEVSNAYFFFFSCRSSESALLVDFCSLGERCPILKDGVYYMANVEFLSSYSPRAFTYLFYTRGSLLSDPTPFVALLPPRPHTSCLHSNYLRNFPRFYYLPPKIVGPPVLLTTSLLTLFEINFLPMYMNLHLRMPFTPFFLRTCHSVTSLGLIALAPIPPSPSLATVSQSPFPYPHSIWSGTSLLLYLNILRNRRRFLGGVLGFLAARPESPPVQKANS